jgi:hypothetical protein
MCLLTDKYFFHETTWVVAPWNSLLYNANTANLASHGIHSRYQHVLVNGFIMYGPMWAATAAACVHVLRHNWHARTVHAMCAWIIVTSVAVLSAAPHQEARFLLPLIIPMALLIGNIAKTVSVGKLVGGALIWITFNLTAGYAFAVLHQGAALPLTAVIADIWGRPEVPHQMLVGSLSASLFASPVYSDPRAMPGILACLKALFSATSQPLLTFVGVYMIPHTLFRQPLNASVSTGWCKDYPTLDWIVETDHPESTVFRARVDSISRSNNAASAVVYPATLRNAILSVLSARNVSWREYACITRHVSMEYPPSSWDDVGLCIALMEHAVP